jgi:hypothetical protein
MTKELVEWLEFRWRKDNHKKYHRYFNEWLKNITQSQIEGFAKQEKRRNVYES